MDAGPASESIALTPFLPVDYDADNDQLIEISSLAQLNAIRWDLNGDGSPLTTRQAEYDAAFPKRSPGMGCPAGDCEGYELSADLDFDSDGDGDVDADDHDGAYWNDGSGWDPISTRPDPLANIDIRPFEGRFDGNRHTISNLFINRPGAYEVGLFAKLDFRKAWVQNVGVLSADVTGYHRVGALVGMLGDLSGGITDSYATGNVKCPVERRAGACGGLVGDNWGTITASYAKVDVTGSTNVGGLVGSNWGTIAASYATGHVAGTSDVGGLVGRHRHAADRIIAS